MGFGQSSLFAKIGIILITIALVIQILGLAIPYWFQGDAGIFSYYGGLFKNCAEVGNSKSCSDVNQSTGWWAAVQAMEIIGLILIIVALVLSIITVFVKEMKVLKLICWILCFFACAVIIIGIIIYGAEAPTAYDQYSGAFAITIIAGIIILIAGILVLLDWMGKGAK